jgi:hypothetical protein
MGVVMDKKITKIGELKFELVIPDDSEDMPTLEIENDACMVYETVDVNKAMQLRKLLDDYIDVMSDS